MQDTFPMQVMLNKFIIPGCLKPTQMLAVDGIIGKKTIAAIKDFQRRICGFSNPDGRIDPGGETLKALNGPLIWAKALAEDKTSEWAIALGAIDSGLVEFKLVNRASGIVHKLAIRSPGILPILINKSFAERWVSFKTSLAVGFDDFNNVYASFSKATILRNEYARTSAADVQARAEYNMALGWLATVPVSPIPAKSFTQVCPVGPVNVSPAFSTLLGCKVDDFVTPKFGLMTIVPGFSQQLEVPIITPSPVPIPYPIDPNLWSPPINHKQLLLSP